jgi:hypothetical protein
MTPAQRARSTWIAAALASAVLLPFLAGTPAAAATPKNATTCTAPASVFDAKADGSLWLYRNTAPATGGAAWTNVHQIGTGWYGRILGGGDVGRSFAGGDILSITPTGDVRELNYNPDNDTWGDGGAYQTISTGFSRYLSGPAAALITTDGDVMYAVDAHGDLRYWPYTDASGNVPPAGVLLDHNWGGYTRIFATGSALYAVDGGGVLHRFTMDYETHEFTEYADPVGTGWGNVRNVFSPGGDVLYVVDAAGTMFWYRYDADTQTWANNGAGVPVGSGWQGVADVTAFTNSCSEPEPAPVPAATPIPATTDAPLGLGATSPGGAPFYYWNDGGTVEYSQDSGPATALRPTPLPGMAGSIPSPVTAAGIDGSTVGIAGLDPNGEVVLVRSDQLDPDQKLAGGAFTALALTSPNGEPQLFGVDPVGHLWTASAPAGAPFSNRTTEWHDLMAGLPRNYPRLTGPLSVGSTGGQVYGVARMSTGSLGYFTYRADGTFTPTVFTGPAGLSTPVAAQRADAPVLAAYGSTDGLVYVNDPGTDVTAFTALAPLPNGRKATSVALAQPAAGVSALAVRADNGQVFVTNTTKPGAWAAWKKLPLDAGVKATTQPALLAGTGADLAFRGSDGKIWHFTAPAPATGRAMTWTGAGHLPAK